MEQYDVLSDKYQKYAQRLKADGNTYVNIDRAQMGLGCVTSWRSLPRPEYQIQYVDQEFKFILLPDVE
jgi:beta-galactosidase